MKRNLLLSAAMLLFAANRLFAQVEIGDISEDNIDLLDYSRPLWEYITGGFFIMCILGIGFLASKRVKNA